jgi:hypothetical protein
VSQPQPYGVSPYGHGQAYGAPYGMAAPLATAAAPIIDPASSMANALKDSAILREALARQLV